MKTCPECGNKFKERFSTLQVCCSIECATAQSRKRWANRKPKLKPIDPAMKTRARKGENKGNLQRGINKLARMIDSRFGYLTCIDCGKPYGKQVDGAHFHSSGSHPAITYNLHNIHSAKSDCNKYSAVHHENYKIGMENRYGGLYLDYVKDLVLEYPRINLTAQDYKEKLKIVRRLIREFDKWEFSGAIDAREVLNKEIGIYVQK